MLKKFFAIIAEILRAIRLIVGTILSVLFLVLLIVLVVTSLGDDVENQSGSVLVLDPKGALVESKSVDDEITRLIFGSTFARQVDVVQLIKTIERATDDDRIVMMVLELDGIASANMSQITDVGNALHHFRNAGKPVIAYSRTFAQSEYLLASAATEIYLHPMGQLLFYGVSFSNRYMKDLLDRLKIHVHAFYAGNYKSAIEPYTRNAMSEYAKEANRHVVDTLWGSMRQLIISNREMTAEQFHTYTQGISNVLNETQGNLASTARDHGFVDGIATKEAFDELVRSKYLELETTAELKKVKYLDYARTVTPYEYSASRSRVGLLFAQGSIHQGRSTAASIGSSSFSKVIKAAKQDPQIKALVLRIDSPGGGVFGAEEIREQLELFVNSGKPLIASMAGTAASGGYWIATAASKIVASPQTITGSIGVFSILPTFERSLESIGVHTDAVTTTPMGMASSIESELSAEMAQVLQLAVDDVYSQFVRIVGESRNLSEEEVLNIAQGRIWTGKDALQNGLIDQLGSLEDALTLAATLADLDNYGITRLDVTDVSPLPFSQYLGGDWSFADALYERIFEDSFESSPILPLRVDPGNFYAICTTCKVSSN